MSKQLKDRLARDQEMLNVIETVVDRRVRNTAAMRRDREKLKRRIDETAARLGL